MMRQALISTVLVLFANAAAAQDNPVRMVIQQSPPSADGGQVRVNVAMSLVISGAAGLSDQAIQAQEQGRRKAYELAAHECAVLRDTIASECHIESMNVSANRYQGSYSGSRPENYSVAINAVYRITLK
jgi:hypothetical protein